MKREKKFSKKQLFTRFFFASVSSPKWICIKSPSVRLVLSLFGIFKDCFHIITYININTVNVKPHILQPLYFPFIKRESECSKAIFPKPNCFCLHAPFLFCSFVLFSSLHFARFRSSFLHMLRSHKINLSSLSFEYCTFIRRFMALFSFFTMLFPQRECIDVRFDSHVNKFIRLPISLLFKV